MSMDEEITEWYARQAREQEAVRQAMHEHRQVCKGGDCKECRQLDRRFDNSSMGD